MFIGNIVSEYPSKINGLFNSTNNMENIINGIPTLIIGWDFCKRIYNNRQLSILDKKITEDVMWTFTKREKRIDYEKDLNFFVKNCINIVENRLNYEYVNTLTTNYSTVKNILKILTSNEVCYIYIYKNSFIYIYTNNNIIGIDFNTIDYLKIDRKKIYKILYGFKNKIFFNDNFLSNDFRKNIIDKQKITPYLYAIQNGERN